MGLTSDGILGPPGFAGLVVLVIGGRVVESQFASLLADPRLEMSNPQALERDLECDEDIVQLIVHSFNDIDVMPVHG